MQKLLLALMCFVISVSFSDAQTISATALKNAAVGAFGKYQPTGASTATPGYGIPLKVGSDGGILPSADPLPPAAATMTPTPTFTWNATTTRTQPPTPTATATNTPVMGQSEVRYMRASDHPTETSYQVVPTTSPTAIVIPATTPGYRNKLEVQVQVPETGTAFFVFTRNGIMENFPPGFRGTIWPLCADNGPMTIQCAGGVTGTIGRLNIYRAIVQDGH